MFYKRGNFKTRAIDERREEVVDEVWVTGGFGTAVGEEYGGGVQCPRSRWTTTMVVAAQLSRA